MAHPEGYPMPRANFDREIMVTPDDGSGRRVMHNLLEAMSYCQRTKFTGKLTFETDDGVSMEIIYDGGRMDRF